MIPIDATKEGTKRIIGIIVFIINIRKSRPRRRTPVVVFPIITTRSPRRPIRSPTRLRLQCRTIRIQIVHHIRRPRRPNRRSFGLRRLARSGRARRRPNSRGSRRHGRIRRHSTARHPNRFIIAVILPRTAEVLIGSTVFLVLAGFSGAWCVRGMVRGEGSRGIFRGL